MKRDPKNSHRPNDGAANLAMLKRTVKKLFSYYPVLAPVTFACILFSAIVTSIPSLFVQNVIQVIEKWYVSRDWGSAKAELIPILSLLISLYVLSIIAILVYKHHVVAVCLRTSDIAHLGRRGGRLCPLLGGNGAGAQQRQHRENQPSVHCFASAS